MTSLELQQTAARLRLQMLETVAETRKGHIGGALSSLDMLIALYHGGVLDVDPTDPGKPDRDRFILSKGHASVGLFTVLSDFGFFDAEEMKTYGQDGSRLGGHPDPGVPGVEVESGSLGQGLSIGCGLALADKLDGRETFNVVMLGDGECYEGSVWEAFAFAGHHGLNRLMAVIDRNGCCVMDHTEDCVQLEPMGDKLTAFGWRVVEVDGHDMEAVRKVFQEARDGSFDQPTAVIARTTKGKGISFMENTLKWHHGVPGPEELEQARNELNEMIGRLS